MRIGGANLRMDLPSVMNTPVEPPETIEVEQTTISCDGDGCGGALGHPKVCLSLAEKGRVECPYCDRLFLLKDGAGGGGQ